MEPADETAIDILIAEILDEAAWINSVPEYEQLARDWPDCPEI